MSEAYLGEIRLFAGNYAPQGWATCDGQMLSIAEFDALFALIGTSYGGDGQTTFALPDLRGRLPVNQGTNPATGTNYPLAQAVGTETVALIEPQMPVHSHPANASATANAESPTNAVWAGDALNRFSTAAPTTSMRPDCIGAVGGSQPHENMMPYLPLTFIISLYGVFPPQN